MTRTAYEAATGLLTTICSLRNPALAASRAASKVGYLARQGRPELLPLEAALVEHKYALMGALSSSRLSRTRLSATTSHMLARDAHIKSFCRRVESRDQARQERIACCAECLHLSLDDVFGTDRFVSVTRDGRDEDLCHPCAGAMVLTAAPLEPEYSI